MSPRYRLMCCGPNGRGRITSCYMYGATADWSEATRAFHAATENDSDLNWPLTYTVVQVSP